MPISLNYEQVRALAKKLKTRPGVDIKLTEVYEDIASVVGRKPDALMHELKTEAKFSLPTPVSLRELSDPEVYAKNDGDAAMAALTEVFGKVVAAKKVVSEFKFEDWSDSSQIFRRLLKTRQFTEGGFVVFDVGLEVIVTPGVDEGEYGPEDAVWAANLNYFEADGAASLVEPVDVEDFGYDGTGCGSKSLMDVIVHIQEAWISRIDEYWNARFDEERIQKYIEETNAADRVRQSVRVDRAARR
jgi:hypothetical protein